MLRTVLRRAAYTTLGGIAIGGTAICSDEGTLRSAIFNFHVLPIYAHYRLVEYQTRHMPDNLAAPLFDALHDRYQHEPLKIFLKLGGFYVKLGQVTSSFGDDIVPKQYVDSLKVLQDKAPSHPISYVHDVIETELGMPVDQIFEEFDERPLGAASIGQVHHAVLKDGKEVVVKVQYPSSEKYFRMDINTVKTFCRFAAPEQLDLLGEIEKQFATEFDYSREAKLLDTAADNMRCFSEVAVPRSVAGLCSKRVLTMEYLPGISLLSSQKKQLEALAAKQGLSARQLEDDMKAKYKAGTLKRVSLPSAHALALYRGWLRFRDAIHNTTVLLYNWTLGWVRAPMEFVKTDAPINVSFVINTLNRVFFHQLFEDGFFNGDPHPGNILLLDDGRLGLIDWGQVKELQIKERLQLAKLLIALADGDEQLTAELWGQMGFATQRNNAFVLNKWAQFRFKGGDPHALMDELGGVGLFQENLNKLDPVVADPSEFVMAFRMMALIRGAAIGLGDLHADSAVSWRKAAVTFLTKHGEPPPRTVRNRRTAYAITGDMNLVRRSLLQRATSRAENAGGGAAGEGARYA